MNVIKGLLKSRLVWVAAAIFLGATVATVSDNYFEESNQEVAAVGEQAEPVQTTETPTPTEAVGTPTSQGPIYTVETDALDVKVATGHLLDGVRVGNWELFYPNGKIESTGQYTKGMRVGAWRFFYSTGQLRSEGRFGTMGVKQGLWATYYTNSDVSTEGKYVDGVRIGRWFAYLYEGHPSFFWVGHFDERGMRHDAWTWHVNGDPVFTDTYENGKFIRRRELATVRPASERAAKPSLTEPEFAPPVIENRTRRGR